MKKLVLSGQVKPDILCAVSFHCCNIRHLDIWEVESGDLEGLNLWENVGCSLEILRLRIESGGIEELRMINKYCRKLQSIKILSRNLDSAALSRCLASYKGQLEYIRIGDGMVDSDLESVVKSCSNAKFDLFCPVTDCFKNFRIIGKKLEKVMFDNCLESIDNLPDFKEIWDSCPNIRNVDAGTSMDLASLELFSIHRKYC